MEPAEKGDAKMEYAGCLGAAAACSDLAIESRDQGNIAEAKALEWEAEMWRERAIISKIFDIRVLPKEVI